MKRFIIFMLTALLGCSMAWANVKVSGKVTVEGEAEGFCNEAIVVLSNDYKSF